MNLARKKLERITEFWNSFVLNNKIIQNQIIWDEEVKTNYYGDILNYFNDTFDLFKRKPLNSNFQDSVFYATGLLQIIFVHQDLTDELLRIFKIAKSSGEEKKSNREIRNEVIGHPVSKKIVDHKLRLESSIIWGEQLTTEYLHYIKYAKNKDFKGEKKTFKIETIVSSHSDFLNKYFDKILNKNRKTLTKYNKQIKEIETALEKNINFENLVDFTSQRYEQVFKLNYLYNVDYLKVCYKRKDEHARYQYVVDYFKNELRECLIETQSYIHELLSEVVLEIETTESVKMPCIEIELVDVSDNSILKNDKSINDHYEITKLGEKHPIYGVSYFKNIFKDNSKIMDELNNMESNMFNDNNLEYYSSYEYLKYLIKIGRKE